MPVDQLAGYGAGTQIHVEDLAAYLAGRERCDAAANAPLLPDQDCLVAVGGQRGLDHVLVWLVQGHRHQQPRRRLARLHAPAALLPAWAETALYLTDPAGETAGIGERRPEVVDLGVEAVLDPHDALAIRLTAGCPGCGRLRGC